MLCECCKINFAVVKDYRSIDFGDFEDIEKYSVCLLCFNLADDAFFSLMHCNSEDKKEMIKDLLLNVFKLTSISFSEFNKLSKRAKIELVNWLNFLDKKDKYKILNAIKKNDKKVYLSILKI